MSIVDRLLRVIILITAITRNSPTPAPTVAISTTLFITELTCSASTDRSGSAIVMKIPIKRQTAISTVIFLDLVRPLPICSPMGVMARSAPRLNSPIPSIRKTADTENTASSVPVKLTSGVAASISTITVTGSTDTNDSRSLSNTVFIIPSDACRPTIIY